VYVFCDTLFNCVWLHESPATFICAGTTLLYMDAGSQRWYIVDLDFTEATVYWYAAASYYMKWAVLCLSR
jgi:hypothetical protein